MSQEIPRTIHEYAEYTVNNFDGVHSLWSHYAAMEEWDKVGLAYDADSKAGNLRRYIEESQERLGNKFSYDWCIESGEYDLSLSVNKKKIEKLQAVLVDMEHVTNGVTVFKG